MRKIVGMALVASIALGLGMGETTAREKPEKKHAETQFKKLDTNSDNKLSKDEFLAKKDGDAKTQAEKRFAKVDTNSDGSISLDEFKAAMARKQPRNRDADARFKKLDTSSDNKISKEEFLAKKDGEAKKRSEKRFAKADTNADGSISLDEFKAAIKAKQKTK